jgi:hypothetical protein
MSGFGLEAPSNDRPAMFACTVSTLNRKPGNRRPTAKARRRNDIADQTIDRRLACTWRQLADQWRDITDRCEGLEHSDFCQESTET